MDGGDRLGFYRDYLACLNERRWDDLGQFVADDVVHNGRRLGLSGYRAMLEADTWAIPDLQFLPTLLFTDGEFVSCRLLFECTPQHAFLGFEPTGERISFAEHVFYRLEDGRIAEVWSVIDVAAIREQCESASSEVTDSEPVDGPPADAGVAAREKQADEREGPAAQREAAGDRREDYP